VSDLPAENREQANPLSFSRRFGFSIRFRWLSRHPEKVGFVIISTKRSHIGQTGLASEEE
jgi:hypothetical protein